MGTAGALKARGITAEVCVYKHFPYSVNEVWTALRYLRKQTKKPKIQRATRNVQRPKILVGTASVCAPSDEVVNSVTY